MLKPALWLCWLGRVLSVRHRYVLTRDNRLRLRYVVPSLALCVLMAVITLAGSVSPSQAVSMRMAAMPIAGEDGAAMAKFSAQKRLQRYAGKSGADTTGPDLKLTSFVPSQKEQREPAPREEIVKIGQGDTLTGALQRAGLGVREAYKAVTAIETHIDPRKIRPGQEIHVRFEPIDEGYEFAGMEIGIDTLRSVSLKKTGEGTYEPAVLEKEVISQVYASRADIEFSLYGAASSAGIPRPVVVQAIQIFSWDVDFQRDVRKGDFLEVMYEQLETADGQKVKTGNLLYARLNVNGQDIPVYRYKMENGDVDYFTANGASIRKALMQTPIDGARLSSGFGKRQHPVLGYEKMHKGVDFAAPRGTPIYAAGDGTVERAGRWNSYGNYIRIRHNASLKTAYAHLDGFAKGVTAGTRVKQGQVIGYVGTTGRSTGPHLHYEVLENDRHINPKNIKLPQGETLKGPQLTAFKRHIEAVNREYASLTGTTKFAARRGSNMMALR